MNNLPQDIINVILQYIGNYHELKELSKISIFKFRDKNVNALYLDFTKVYVNDNYMIPIYRDLIHKYANQLIILHINPCNCKKRYCLHRLHHLPSLPKCESLICENQGLLSLPELPLCKEIFCTHNDLTHLPSLPNCKKLICWDNWKIPGDEFPKDCIILINMFEE